MMDGYLYYAEPFDHDHVTINSYGETLDRDDPTTYSKNRIAWQLKQRIMAEEDAAIFRILDSIAKSGNNVI